MKEIQITAANQEKALRLAQEQLAADAEVDLDSIQLEIKQVGKKSGFLGIGRKFIYQITVKDGLLSKREEGILDIVTTELGIDGTFRIKITAQGIFLWVTPPEEPGKPVSYERIKQALEEKEIIEIDWPTVQEAIHEGNNQWEKIAPRLPERDRDAEVAVKISQDQLSAHLNYYPALGGKKLTAAEIIKILNENRVVFGVDQDKINELVKKDLKLESVLIAKGKPPEQAKDAELVYHFDDKKKSIGTKREDGSIDYYDLGLINNVQPGDILVSKQPPEPGIPGKAVTGEEISPPPPKDKELPGGKNVERRDDQTLVAKILGQVVVDGNRINVLPNYEVNGDVDLSTGNIDFVGNVLIKGNILEGFIIKASGNVEVRGHVFTSDIDAGGDVIIQKGFVGKNKCHIKAKGNVNVKFVENGTIESEKSILVSDAIMHSQITVAEKLEVTKNKGLLVGGVIRAGNSIEANIIGSHLATATILEVGIDPQLKNKMGELEEVIKKDRSSLNKSLKAIEILIKLRSEIGTLPEDKNLMLIRLQSTANRLQEDIDRKKLELENFEKKYDKIDAGRIVVNKKIYPGVKISIGKSHYNVYNALNRTCFIEEEGDIRQKTI